MVGCLSTCSLGCLSTCGLICMSMPPCIVSYMSLFGLSSIGFLGCGYTCRDMFTDIFTWLQLPITLANMK